MKRRFQMKKFYFISGMAIFFCIMAIGYAYLKKDLNVGGTSQVVGIWDIKFINVTSIPYNHAFNREDPIMENNSVTFNVGLTEPGDKMTYLIRIKNNGNIDAIVQNINLSTTGTNSDIQYSYKNIAVGNILNAGATQDFRVIVEYKMSATTINTTPLSLTLTISYLQKIGSNINITDAEIAPPATMTLAEAKNYALGTENSGLYADDVEEGRYFFKGASPYNWIRFNNEDWRILSYEADGTMKIVRNGSIGSRAWDAPNNRNKTDDTYCTYSGDGCNAWAKTDNLLDTTGHAPTEFKLYYPNGNSSSDTTTYAGSVTTTDASLNTYLNVTYYENLLGTDKQYIVTHDFNVGTPGYSTDEETVATDVEQEKSYVWNGKIGLITATEYMRATTSTTCTSLKNAYYSNNGETNCGTNNWLKSVGGSYYWTISPFVYSRRRGVWGVNSSGCLGDDSAYSSGGVAPAVYLDSNILLAGSGKQNDKFEILGIQ